MSPIEGTTAISQSVGISTYIAGNLIALFRLGLDRENYAFFGKMIIRKVVAFILKIFTMQKKRGREDPISALKALRRNRGFLKNR